MEGNAFLQHKVIKINAYGYAMSWRTDNEDHYVYFGSSTEMNGHAVNDVICSSKDGFAD